MPAREVGGPVGRARLPVAGGGVAGGPWTSLGCVTSGRLAGAVGRAGCGVRPGSSIRRRRVGGTNRPGGDAGAGRRTAAGGSGARSTTIGGGSGPDTSAAGGGAAARGCTGSGTNSGSAGGAGAGSGSTATGASA